MESTNSDERSVCSSCEQRACNGSTVIQGSRARYLCHVCQWHSPDCKTLVLHWQLSSHALLCSGCDGAFTDTASLEVHKISQYACRICGLHHLDYNTFHAHMATQKELCTGCGLQFCTIETLRAHLQTFRHSHLCWGCYSQFQTGDDLADHLGEQSVRGCAFCHVHIQNLQEADMTSHLAVKHKVCPQCFLRAPDAAAFYDHLESTGHATMCQDERCQALFDSKLKLIDHLASAFACPRCHTHFPTLSELLGHQQDSGHIEVARAVESPAPSPDRGISPIEPQPPRRVSHVKVEDLAVQPVVPMTSASSALIAQFNRVEPTVSLPKLKCFVDKCREEHTLAEYIEHIHDSTIHDMFVVSDFLEMVSLLPEHLQIIRQPVPPLFGEPLAAYEQRLGLNPSVCPLCPLYFDSLRDLVYHMESLALGDDSHMEKLVAILGTLNGDGSTHV